MGRNAESFAKKGQVVTAQRLYQAILNAGDRVNVRLRWKAANAKGKLHKPVSTGSNTVKKEKKITPAQKLKALRLKQLKDVRGKITSIHNLIKSAGALPDLTEQMSSLRERETNILAQLAKLGCKRQPLSLPSNQQSHVPRYTRDAPAPRGSQQVSTPTRVAAEAPAKTSWWRFGRSRKPKLVTPTTLMLAPS